MSTPAPIRNTTAATARARTIAKPRLIQQRPTVPVFSPKHLADDVLAYGHYFHFEPFSVVEIGDIRQHARDDKNRLILRKPPSIVVEARVVADFIVSQECRGQHHFVILQSPDKTPEREEEKRAATQGWVGVYLELSEQEIAGWERFVSLFRTERPGAQPPIMPKHVKRAYEFRKLNAQGLIGRREFICGICSDDFDTTAEYDDHVKTTHPGATAVATTPIIGKPALAPEPVVPRTAQGSSAVKEKLVRRGTALIAQAEEAEIELTVADKKGLSAGDGDVIVDVTQRIEKVAKARKEAAAADVPPPGA